MYLHISAVIGIRTDYTEKVTPKQKEVHPFLSLTNRHGKKYGLQLNEEEVSLGYDALTSKAEVVYISHVASLFARKCSRGWLHCQLAIRSIKKYMLCHKDDRPNELLLSERLSQSDLTGCITRGRGYVRIGIVCHSGTGKKI